ncbi:MAG TPA: hypothetical protein PLE45_01320 [Spirochaetota bacterium]|nr:hypothetical protein [Spirochaetota bacterium]HOL56860.1 hypothetical protein [Spirochaetota bacterium]
MAAEIKRFIVFFLFLKIFLYSEELNLTQNPYFTSLTFSINNKKIFLNSFELNTKIANDISLYSTETKENPFRRAEILFFGSLTIVSFGGWLGFSIYNLIIYGDNFGVLRREQFLALYLGSSLLALSVSISDLLKRNNKFKNVEFF